MKSGVRRREGAGGLGVVDAVGGGSLFLFGWKRACSGGWVVQEMSSSSSKRTKRCLVRTGYGSFEGVLILIEQHPILEGRRHRSSPSDVSIGSISGSS